jgi:hypothetical protein
MKNEELFSRMHDLCKEIDKHHKKDASETEENADPRVAEPVEEGEFDPEVEKLIQEAWKIQKRLDPMVREAMKDNPEALAEWDRIMHMCVADGLDPDAPDPDPEEA